MELSNKMFCRSTLEVCSTKENMCLEKPTKIFIRYVMFTVQLIKNQMFIWEQLWFD